jgi:tyrosyl-tRNA synthetase
MPDEMPEVSVDTGGKPIGIAQLLKQAGLTASTSEAFRAIEQGGVRIDGERCSDRALALGAGRTLVLQVGKRKFARVTLC